MQIYSGKSVFSGIAIGKICVYQKSEQQVKRVRTEDSEKRHVITKQKRRHWISFVVYMKKH